MAILATLIWSGNFIIARGVIKLIPPVSLAFYRWLSASVIIFPFAIKSFRSERKLISRHWKYFFWLALTGITLFNTCVYIAGHYSPAINLALIGTTSSPIFVILLAAIFLREKITILQCSGLIICITGIVLLLSKGSMERLLTFRFSTGDWWILCGAMLFAIYTILVRTKPVSISPINFLFVTFTLGLLLLFPFYIWEVGTTVPVKWNGKLLLIILYLGFGASIIAFFCWNASIAILGSSRTAMFGNLIPIFSAFEAVVLLDEGITAIYAISGILVISGLVIANTGMKKISHNKS